MVNGLDIADAVVRYQVAGQPAPGRRRAARDAVPVTREAPTDAVAPDGTITAVAGVSLHVEPGEIVALLGASGSGKSSLLRAVAGLEPLAAGRVSWDGADLAGVPTHKRNMGLMFQDPALFPNLSVGKNVAYGLHKLPRARRAGVVERFLELVGLPGYASRQVSELSGGQAQRVALARSLAPEPRLMLLDEPLSALDRALRERLVGVLSEVLRATGTTAIHVTHDQDEAFALADRVGVMAAGKLLQFDRPEVLWRRPVSVEVATFLGYDLVLTPEDAEALGVGTLRATAPVALGPESLFQDAAGAELAIVDQLARRGYVEVGVRLPSGQRAELRVPDRLDAETVRVRTDPDAVSVVQPG
ncbi:ABC transporter ATP-binding protein [Propioniciclava coleopterorum]|uniref:ABC transporter ATP-binding protein n=1 Tax=Propioniciclava coleopterorum TaxID=2714937 RepID=UPI001FE84C97|nr:ABC transporter ATP-binding protein [Propioniciclava coleopterorum]